MNEQFPPVDAGLRNQLTRRSSGRLPEGLLDEVSAGLDAVSSARPIVHVSFVHPSPKVSGALVGLAAVIALLAAVVAVPALRNASTGPSASPAYPTNRALTTAELAAMLDAGTLKPYNAVVVDAEVTADASGACRAPEASGAPNENVAGFIAGIDPPVCVYTIAGKTRGVMIAPGRHHLVLRVLGDRALGFMGTVPDGPSGLAFTVSDDWPQDRAFVVDGWLGAVDQSVSCAEAPQQGDVLLPSGDDCPYQDWLSDDSSSSVATDVVAQAELGMAGQQALFGQTRLVQAGGMRMIDGLDTEIKAAAQNITPVHGEYVVEPIPERCPSAVNTSTTCAYWLVVAKLADITPPPTETPAPTATPTPSPAYPTERALTTDELAALLDAGTLKLYDTVVADAVVTANASTTCPLPDDVNGVFAGFIAGIDPPVCVHARIYGGVTTPTIVPGHLVLRVLGDRTLGYMGTIPDTPNGLAFSATDSWPDGFFLVHGWLDTDDQTCGESSLPGYGGPDPLFPEYSSMCHAALSTTSFVPTTPTESPGASGPVASPAGGPGAIPIASFPVPADGHAVDAAPYFEIPAYRPSTGSTEGVFLVDRDPHCSSFDPSACEDYFVLARLTDVAPPNPAPTPSVTPAPTPTPQTLAYPTEHALTTDEFNVLFNGGRLEEYDTVVVDATIDPTGISGCPIIDGMYEIHAVGVLLGVDLKPCVYATGKTAVVPGHLILRLIGDRTLGYLGTIATPAEGMAFKPGELWPTQDTILATGWLGASSAIYSCTEQPAIESPNPLDPGSSNCGEYWLSPTPYTTPVLGASTTPPPGAIRVKLPNYPGVSIDSGQTTSEATYVLRMTDGGGFTGWQILARLTDVVPPNPTASPTATPTPTHGPSTAIYPTDRALTADEFGRMLDVGTPRQNDTVVVDGTVEPGSSGCTIIDAFYPINLVGKLKGISPEPCVYSSSSSPISSGRLVFRMLSPAPGRMLGYLGTITTPVEGMVYKPTDTWPTTVGETFLTQGYMGQIGVMCPVEPQPTPTTGSGNPLDPNGADPCAIDYISSSAGAGPLSTPPDGQYVNAAGARILDSIPGSPTYGVYVVRYTGDAQLGPWKVLARLTDIPQTDVSERPTPTPTPTPTTAPSRATGTPLTALWGSGNRPLTVGEFASLSASSPTSLEGRTVIAKGPIPGCVGVILTSCPAPIAGEGYWVVDVDTRGRTSIVGELSTPGGRFVSTLDQVTGDSAPSAGSLIVVDAYLLIYPLTCNRDSTPVPSGCNPSELHSTAADQSPYALTVQDDAYQRITGLPGDVTGDGPPVHGVFLLRMTSGDVADLLGQMSTANP